IDPVELVSGADRQVRLSDDHLLPFNAANRIPRRPLRVIDEAEGKAAPTVARLDSGLVIESRDEGAVILLAGAADEPWGAWAADAVLLVAGVKALEGAEAGLRAARIRLVALALDGGAVDAAIARLRPRLGRAGLMVLEAGLALEV